MPHYYKIANPRRKIKKVDEIESCLDDFLTQQRSRQGSVYRSAAPETDILYKCGYDDEKRITRSSPSIIEIVSDREMPLDFVCELGDLVEGPNPVSKANHFFMAKSFMDGKPTFEQCCDIVRGIIGSYDLEINFSPLYSFPKTKSSFPSILINVLTDGVFVGYTIGEIIEAVKFYEHFSTRFTEEMQYLPHKSHSLSFK